jgi:hypothetical protein
MNDNAQNGILLNLVAVLAMATLALAFLQSLGNTPIRATTTCRQSHRRGDSLSLPGLSLQYGNSTGAPSPETNRELIFRNPAVIWNAA